MYNTLFFRSKDFVESTEKDYIDKFKALSQYDMASLYTFFNQLSERYVFNPHFMANRHKGCAKKEIFELVLLQKRFLNSLFIYRVFLSSSMFIVYTIPLKTNRREYSKTTYLFKTKV